MGTRTVLIQLLLTIQKMSILCWFEIFHYLAFRFQGKKKSAKKKVVSDGWAWDKEREHALCLISQLLQLDVNRLWDPPIVEEEFVKYVIATIFVLFGYFAGL